MRYFRQEEREREERRSGELVEISRRSDYTGYNIIVKRFIISLTSDRIISVLCLLGLKRTSIQ